MFRNKKSIIFVLAMVFLSQAQQSYARSGDRRDRGPRPDYYTPHYEPHGRAMRDLPDDYIRMIFGGMEYYYWEGMFYRLMEDRYVVVPAPIGAVVTAIPPGSQPVIIDGITYYNINGVTYMYTPYGYEVVPQPKTIIVKNYAANPGVSANLANNVTENVAAVNPATNSKVAKTSGNEESFTVNITNSKGGYTAVSLKRSGTGFIGPQGEYYTEFPKIEQLKVMYGK